MNHIETPRLLREERSLLFYAYMQHTLHHVYHFISPLVTNIIYQIFRSSLVIAKDRKQSFRHHRHNFNMFSVIRSCSRNSVLTWEPVYFNIFFITLLMLKHSICMLGNICICTIVVSAPLKLCYLNVLCVCITNNRVSKKIFLKYLGLIFEDQES